MTREGHFYGAEGNYHAGLPSSATVQPKTNLSVKKQQKFDAIIIGAGYAGLTAARDLTTTGKMIL